MLPEPIMKMHSTEYDPEDWARRINGFFWADSKVGDKTYKRGQLVPAFAALMKTAQPLPSTGFIREAGRKKTATSQDGATPARRPCRLILAFSPTGRGAGLSTAVFCTTARLWT